MDQATLSSAYDVNRIRADFPILAMQVYGKPLVYLDNAASAQKPKVVLDRLDEVYTSQYANVHRGLHFLANEATEAYENAREKVAAFINARRKEEVVFTRNATEAINLVAYTFGRERIKAGDEIVVSIMEHHSNIVPWHFLRERQGAVIKWAPVDDEGNFLIEEFEKLLTPRTKLVAITHMSNMLGTMVPAKEVVRIAHVRGIPVLFDGAQAAVHLDVDLRDIDCDFYAFTGHKLYGPTGIGVLWGRYELLAELPVFLGGGEMIETVDMTGTTFAKPPHRFEAGTPPIAQAVGLGAAIDYVSALGMHNIQAHEEQLTVYALDALSTVDGLRIIGPATGIDRGATIAFTMRGVHPHDVAQILDEQGIAVRAGHHCARPVCVRYGIPATTRASFGVYTTTHEIDVLVRGLEQVKEVFG